ncbi:MAG: helix-turn-helix domain-containing protein [Chloroflexota bacterium]
MDYSKQVPAAERTLNILEALSGALDGLSATELLERLDDMSRSGLFALLNTLKARSYVEQSDSRGMKPAWPALWALLPPIAGAGAVDHRI